MKNKVKGSGTVDFERAVKFFEEALAGLKSRDLVLSHHDESVNLHPMDAVEVEIEGKEKDGRQKFSFEMSWSEGMERRELADFRISFGEHSTREHREHSKREHKKFRSHGEGKAMVASECLSTSGGAEAWASCSEM